jgi:hypothetical protein
MSNHPSNKEQDQLIELSPCQLNPGIARPTDFKMGKTYETQPPLPGHGNAGDTLAEHRKLMREAAESPGLSKPAPIPQANPQ